MRAQFESRIIAIKFGMYEREIQVVLELALRFFEPEDVNTILQHPRNNELPLTQSQQTPAALCYLDLTASLIFTTKSEVFEGHIGTSDNLNQ